MKKGRENSEELRRKLEEFVASHVGLLEPLKSVDEKQVAAVATLSYLLQGVIQAVHEVDITSSFDEELAAISPTLATLASNAAAPHIACWDETIAYLTLAKECEDSGDPTHHSCKEAGFAMGRLVECEMAQLDRLKGIIGDLWHGLEPPRPPWPKMFAVGLVIGLIVGLAVGYTIAPRAIGTIPNQIQEKDSQISHSTSQIAELEQPVLHLAEGEWNNMVTITGSTSKLRSCLASQVELSA